MEERKEFLEERKLKIALSSIPVFEKQGYTNTSMKDIMEIANVSRGGLYAHFDNIHSVFLEALKIVDAKEVNLMNEIDKNEELFPQLCDWLVSVVKADEVGTYKLVRAKSEFFLAHSKKDLPYIGERYATLLNSIVSFIELGKTTGEFKMDVPSQSLAILVISTVDGLLLGKVNSLSSNMDLNQELKLLLEMLSSTLVR